MEDALNKLEAEQEQNIGLLLDLIARIEQEASEEIQNVANKYLTLEQEEFRRYLTIQLTELVPRNLIELINLFVENYYAKLFNLLHHEYQLRLWQKFTSIAEDFYEINEGMVDRSMTAIARIFDLEYSSCPIRNSHLTPYKNFELHLSENRKLFSARRNLTIPLLKGIPLLARCFQKNAVERFKDLFQELPSRLCFALGVELDFQAGNLAADLRLRVKMVSLSLRSILERAHLSNIPANIVGESLRAADEDLFQLRVWQDILLQSTEKYPA